MTLERFAADRKRLDCRAAWRAGNVSVLFGITLPIVVGFCGLGADVGYWYYQTRTLQTAADAAAYDGTVELKAGGSLSQIKFEATSGARANGWLSANGTISVYSPPISGNYQNANSVQVILAENLPRFFSALYSNSPVQASAAAVATMTAGVGCVLALDPRANDAINLSGSADLQTPHCNVISDSNSSTAIDMTGSAQLTAPCIISVGSATVTRGLTLTKCSSPTNYAQSVADPYGSVTQPTPSGPCLTVPNRATTLYPGWYCHGLATSWGTITYQSGLYMVTGGGLNMSAGTIASGTGVTFFVGAGEQTAISGSTVINFSAPTGTAYSGIVFFGDRNATNGNNAFSGSSSSTIAGAIYYPTQNVTYSGGAANGTACTQLIGDTITISGSALFGGCSGGGNGTVALVE